MLVNMERYESGRLKISQASQRNVRFVYVMQDAGSGSVKIGVSNNVAVRSEQIEYERKCSVDIFWHVGVPFDKGMTLEQSVHRRLKRTECHKRGEWYIIDPEVAVDVIKRALDDLDIQPVKEMAKADVKADQSPNFYCVASDARMSMCAPFKPFGGI